LIDPYAEKKHVWPYYLGIALVLVMILWGLWMTGVFGK